MNIDGIAESTDVTAFTDVTCLNGCLFEKNFIHCTTFLPASCLPSIFLKKASEGHSTSDMTKIENMHIGILLHDGIVLHYFSGGLSLAEKWTNCVKVPIPMLEVKEIRSALLQYCVALISSDRFEKEKWWSGKNYDGENNNCLDFVLHCLIRSCAIQKETSKHDFVSQFISPFWCECFMTKFCTSESES